MRLTMRILLTCVLFLAITLVYSFQTKAENAKKTVDNLIMPENTTEVLKKNASELNPISLVWKKKRTSVLSIKNLILKTKCLYDYDFLGSETSVFMWQNNQFYYFYTDNNAIVGDFKDLPYAYEVDEKKLKIAESISERSFDGKDYYSGNGYQSESSGLGIYPIQKMQDRTYPDVVNQEYTSFIGYKFPNTGTELGNSPIAYVLYLVNNGTLIDCRTEQSTTDGELLFLKIKSKDIWSNTERVFNFWLVNKYGAVVKKFTIESLDGKLVQAVENHDFFKLSNKSVYFPQKTTVNYYSYHTIPLDISKTPIFTDEYVLVEASTKSINDKQFDLRTKYSNPGTHIGDRTLKDTPDGVQYIVPANPADLDRVIEAALTGGNFTPTPLASTFAVMFRWLILLTGVGMIIYALFAKFAKKSS